MKFCEYLGYEYHIDEGSPLSGIDGRVYKHIEVVSLRLGRELDKGEVVIHIDGDVTNNSKDNLKVLSLEGAKEYLKKEKEDKQIKHFVCQNDKCGKDFYDKVNDRKYCSDHCAKTIRKFEVSASELKGLVWEMPTTQVAKIFGVSDSAIGKRCKELGVEKPPRGYWAKVRAGNGKDIR